VTDSAVRASAIDTLHTWRAPDPAQDAIRQAVLAFLLARPDACQRACVPGHITASSLVLDSTGTRALLTLHPRIGRWLQLGGHCEDGDTDIVTAALREAREESGIADLTIDPNLAAVHVHPVTCSLGVPTRHLDLQFVVHAPPEAEITCSAESVALRWWPLDALPEDTDFGLAQLAQAARTAVDGRRGSERAAQTSLE
jgi:8-oxo-dGTP pyrophosphatase MutT (NUDIX family)